MYKRQDETWHSYEVSDFHQSREPEQWTTMKKPGREGREERRMVCTGIHPRLLRRSCFFQRQIKLSRQPFSVKLTAAAKGVYETFVNGSKADDSVLSPGVREKYLEYQEMDVTAYIREGTNTILFWMGNGWYNCASWGELLYLSGLSWSLNISTKASLSSCEGTFAHLCVVSNFG